MSSALCIHLPLYSTLLNVLVIMRNSGLGVSPICTISEMPTMPCDLCCASDILWYSSLLKPYSWICVRTKKRMRFRVKFNCNKHIVPLLRRFHRLRYDGQNVNHFAPKLCDHVVIIAHTQSARRNHKRRNRERKRRRAACSV